MYATTVLSRGRGRGRERLGAPVHGARRFACAALAGALVALVPFLAVLWNFGVRPLRTALPLGYFSNFYDLQARALMHGHLDVPHGSLSIEAFEINGRDYMYFPPWPSLLRMPVLAVTDAYDGRMTALSMLLAWIVTVVCTALLVWRVRTLVRPGVALGWGEATIGGALVASVAGGSVLVYLAALPWVYHEVYLWSTAMAIGALFAIIGVLQTPTTGRLLAAATFSLGAMLTRVTAGWACCLTLVAVALLMSVREPHRRHRALGVLAAGVVPLAVGIALNWAKFRHPFLFPLEDQVWSDLSAHRRQALAANGGSLTGPQFFLTSLYNYFNPAGIRFVSIFPYITLPARPAHAVGGAFLDQGYRTGSVTAFMPLLFLLGAWGLVATFRRRAPEGIALLRLPVLGGIAITVGVMFYGYIAHRYTTEFLPGLTLAGSIGLYDLVSRAGTWARPARRLATGGFAALVVFGLMANAAIGTVAARVAFGDGALRNLVRVQERLSDWTGDPLDRYVRTTHTLPLSAPADRLYVIDDCQSVYRATGDLYEPWTPVDIRGIAFEITVTGEGRSGWLPLVSFEGLGDRDVMLVHGADGDRRVLIKDSFDLGGSDWRTLRTGDTVVVEVVPEIDALSYRVSSFGWFEARTPMSDWRVDREIVPNVMRITVPNAAAQEAQGVRIRAHRRPAWETCTRLTER